MGRQIKHLDKPTDISETGYSRYQKDFYSRTSSCHFHILPYICLNGIETKLVRFSILLKF